MAADCLFVQSVCVIISDSDVTMKVYPTTLNSTGGWVKVTWSYVDNPSENDWVGVYSPPVNDSSCLINPSKHAPIKLLVSRIFTLPMNSVLFICPPFPFCLSPFLFISLPLPPSLPLYPSVPLYPSLLPPFLSFSLNLSFSNHPASLQMANYSSSHLTSGRGYLQFKLLNMRAPVVFGFFQGGEDNRDVCPCVCGTVAPSMRTFL